MEAMDALTKEHTRLLQAMHQEVQTMTGQLETRFHSSQLDTERHEKLERYLKEVVALLEADRAEQVGKLQNVEAVVRQLEADIKEAKGTMKTESERLEVLTHKIDLASVQVPTPPINATKPISPSSSSTACSLRNPDQPENDPNSKDQQPPSSDVNSRVANIEKDLQTIHDTLVLSLKDSKDKVSTQAPTKPQLDSDILNYTRLVGLLTQANDPSIQRAQQQTLMQNLMAQQIQAGLGGGDSLFGMVREALAKSQQLTAEVAQVRGALGLSTAGTETADHLQGQSELQPSPSVGNSNISNP